MLVSEPCCFPPLTWQSKVSHFHPPSGFHSSYRMLSKCNKTTVVYNCYCIDCEQKVERENLWSRQQCSPSFVVLWPKRQSQTIRLLSIFTFHWEVCSFKHSLCSALLKMMWITLFCLHLFPNLLALPNMTVVSLFYIVCTLFFALCFSSFILSFGLAEKSIIIRLDHVTVLFCWIVSVSF